MSELLTTRSGPGDRVAEIVLNRPRRRNALSAASVVALRDALAAVVVDPGISVILLRGSGGCFCSGIDLAELPREPEQARRWTGTWSDVHRLLAGADVPVVAAVDGAAVNAGAALALSADLRVVGEAAFLQVQEVARDMVPWANAAWLAARYGPARTLDLVLTGRRVEGRELYRLGMAHSVVPDPEVLDRARDLATSLAGHPRRAVARTKALVRELGGLAAPAAVAAAFAAALAPAAPDRSR